MMNSSLVMPFVRISDFLDVSTHEELLEWTCNNSQSFRQAVVGVAVVDARIRIAHVARPPKDIRRRFRAQLGHRFHDIADQLRIRPFGWLTEIEAAAHGDGAKFLRHVDTARNGLGGQSRRISAVYYYHREPKNFDGGALRLHALTGPAFVDIMPEQNMLLAFPSYAPHEVRPVQCPSGRFDDYRFAINIWLHDAATIPPRSPNESAASTTSELGT